MKNIYIAFSLFLLTVCFSCKRGPNSRPVQYVAYVGFNYLDDEKGKGNNYLDSLYIVGLQTYLTRLNERVDPNLYPVEYRLKTYQCDYKADTIPQIYESIAADTSIALVIDNTWGKYIRNAAPIIRDRLPVISISADQNRLDFRKNAIFLQPNDPQPNYFVQFIDKVLKKKSVGFVTECDYLLHNLFVESMRANKIKYDSVCLWQRSYIQNREVPQDSIVAMERYLRKLLSKPEPEVILFNTHGGYADAIMNFLKLQ